MLQKSGPQQDLKLDQRVESVSGFQAKVQMFFSLRRGSPADLSKCGVGSASASETTSISTAPTQSLREARERGCLCCPLPSSNTIQGYHLSSILPADNCCDELLLSSPLHALRGHLHVFPTPSTLAWSDHPIAYPRWLMEARFLHKLD